MSSSAVAILDGSVLFCFGRSLALLFYLLGG
jgi:hypothetical protein